MLRRLLFYWASVAVLLPAAALDSPPPAEFLLDQARAAPVEIFADVAFGLLRAGALPAARQVEVLEEIFRRAGEARQALPMRPARAEPALAGRTAILARAHDLHLDALSLRSRAVQLLVRRDARLARRLFDEIPPREWDAATCDPHFVPDPRLYYTALADVLSQGAFTALEREKQEPWRLAEGALRSISISEELVAISPYLHALLAATGDAERIRTVFGSAAEAVKTRSLQKPACGAAAKPKAWANEAEFRALLEEIGGLQMTGRDTPGWAFRALQIMGKVDDWHPARGVSAIEAFHQRVQLWQQLEDRCPPGDLHRKALEGLVSTLNEPAVIRDAPAEWLVHVRYPVFRASIFTAVRRKALAQAGTPFDESFLDLPQQLMQASPSAIVALYGQLAALRITAE